MSLIWINGCLVDKADAGISLFDHGFLYGDGVWEPLRIFGGRPHLLSEHLESLICSASHQGVTVPLSREELATAIESTAAANGRTGGYARIIVTRGPGTLGPDPRKIDPQVIIIVEEYRPFPLELVGHGIHAITFTTYPAGARLLGWPGLVQAKRHALENGCLEAILLDRSGEVMGTTEGMLFVVKPGGIVGARGDFLDVLGASLVSMASEDGIPVVECAVRKEELLAPSEVLVCGTACGIFGIVQIDGQVIGGGVEGPITRRLRELYIARTADIG